MSPTPNLMPTRAPTLRSRSAPSRGELRREADDRRREASPWRALYGTARWQRIRAAQLAAEPLCAMCLAEGGTMPALVCDHVVPHRGDVEHFFAGPFQSLCKPHHDGAKQRAERQGSGAGQKSQERHP